LAAPPLIVAQGITNRAMVQPRYAEIQIARRNIIAILGTCDELNEEDKITVARAQDRALAVSQPF